MRDYQLTPLQRLSLSQAKANASRVALLDKEHDRTAISKMMEGVYISPTGRSMSYETSAMTSGTYAKPYTPVPLTEQLAKMLDALSLMSSIKAPSDLPMVARSEPIGRTFYAGYGDWKFDKRTFRARVERIVRDLPAVMQRFKADFVAVRGTSGIFIAAAVQVQLDVPILLMRKPGEDSHGRMLEGDYNHSYKRGLILDDFISSGSTVDGMIEDMADAGLVCVGVLTHASAEVCTATLTYGHSPTCGIRKAEYC